MNTGMSIATIAIAALCTFATRLVPFVLFGRKRTVPRIVVFLGNVLPPAIIATLIVYCLKSVNLLAFPSGIPELISIAAVVLLHLWKRNTLLSVGAGTICSHDFDSVCFRVRQKGCTFSKRSSAIPAADSLKKRSALFAGEADFFIQNPFLSRNITQNGRRGRVSRINSSCRIRVSGCITVKTAVYTGIVSAYFMRFPRSRRRTLPGIFFHFQLIACDSFQFFTTDAGSGMYAIPGQIHLLRAGDKRQIPTGRLRSKRLCRLFESPPPSLGERNFSDAGKGRQN